ncbi:hypothetical protein N7454_009590 [Penicillium verhagenii]|nr:hypothetical protein N7454_009590 [Penicillium verhagenii]
MPTSPKHLAMSKEYSDSCFDSPSSITKPGLKFREESSSSFSDLETQRAIQGSRNFHRLGWKRLTVILIVEAIALGSLSLPAAFATLGLVGGIIATVGIGLVATYASYIVGAVKIKYPDVEHYGDIGRLILGDWGFWIITIVFILSLLLTAGSHCLTGIIALSDITGSHVCTIVFGLVSALILLCLSIPPTFADLAVLGYIDFASIMIAIGITIIATGVQRSHMPDGMSSSSWSAWPKEDTDFATGMVAINNIVFAFSFAPALPSFMNEMREPEDYKKSVYTLGGIEIVLYTVIGSLVYVFVGQDVQSPALLSAGTLVSRIAFGFALPVIFISGSINISVLARYLHTTIYRDSVIRYVNTKTGWVTWITLVAVLTLSSWVIAEAIPVFSSILSIAEGSWNSKQNLRTTFYNVAVFLFGMGVFICGMYASIVDLVHASRDGVGRPFSCSSS